MRDRILSLSMPEPNTGCWIWLATVDRCGYGKIFGRRSVGSQLAHRASYMAFVGEIPKGLTLDHLCNVTCCVNPDHLKPATNRDNTLRGGSPSAIHARQTHCKHGHPFDEANTYRVMGRHGRVVRACRICQLRRVVAYQRRKRAEVR